MDGFKDVGFQRRLILYTFNKTTAVDSLQGLMSLPSMGSCPHLQYQAEVSSRPACLKSTQKVVDYPHSIHATYCTHVYISQDRVSLCNSLGCPGIRSVDPAGFNSQRSTCLCFRCWDHEYDLPELLFCSSLKCLSMRRLLVTFLPQQPALAGLGASS